ncbi:MAG TPA: phosphopyruvate hydratase [Candidatus Methanofastidiosa archaeon]|nr:phosphopyruvate hydratase [Candidatus Methanofastidiosa archaeon]
MLKYEFEDYEITDVWAREVLDSRGNPTVEVEVVSQDGYGKAIVPSGASTGSYEALELRDGDERYGGKGVLNAVNNVNETISDLITGMDVTSQREIDIAMIEKDGTKGKSNLGANAILGASMACAACAADTLNLHLYEYLGGPNAHVLPVPMSNVLNAGVHGASSLELQEFMIMPVGEKTFYDGLRAVSEIYHELKKIVARKYGENSTGVGDEGGYSPPMKKVKEPLEMLVKAIEETGYDKSVKIALDAAASEFYNKGNGTYTLEGKELSKEDLIERYVMLTDSYPIVSIEDPFAEDDFESFSILTSAIGNKVQIVGDDLYVTNPKRLRNGIRASATNALLLKVNQIGTVTEALDAANMSFRKGWGVVVSHRSGETEDTFISDLSVALNCGQIKTGAPCRSERTAKYNQLLRIEEQLDTKARYAGKRFRNPMDL